MAFDYPSSPVLNQVYTAPTGQGYIWNGTAWNLAQTSPQAPVASDNPPANPYAGQLWLRSTTGALYCWYADPNSSQWIQIPGIAPVNDPYKFNTADMQLRGRAAGVVSVNTKADGTGTDVVDIRNTGIVALASGGIAYVANGPNSVGFKWLGGTSILQMDIDQGGLRADLWSANNTSLTKANPGLLKLQNGLIFQWGYTAGSAADIMMTFPTAFPTACANVFAQAAGNPAQNVLWMVNVDQVGPTQWAYRPRYASAGTVAMGTIPCFWLAIGW